MTLNSSTSPPKGPESLPDAHPLLVYGLAWATLSAFLFSSKVILAKWVYASHPISPIHLLVLRMGSVLPLYIGMAIWSCVRSGRFITIKEAGALVVLGACGYHVSSFLDFCGMRYISAGLERMVLYLFPGFVLLLNAWEHKKPIKMGFLPSFLLCYVGIYLMYKNDLGNAGKHTVWGICLVALAALVYSFFVVYGKKYIDKLGHWKFTSLAMLSATLGLFIQYWASTEKATEVLFHIPREVLFGAVLMGIFCTFIPSFLSNISLYILGPERMSLMGTVGPIATLLLGTYILKEKMTVWQWSGVGLILIGTLSFQLNWRAYINKMRPLKIPLQSRQAVKSD